MKLFMCFGGAAAAVLIGDDEAAAPRHRGLRRGRRSLSFRGKLKFLPGTHNKGGCSEKKPSAAPPLGQPTKRGADADNDDGVYGVSRASSVASSALLSSASSWPLDSSDTSSSSSSLSRSSSASSSPSVSGMLSPPSVKLRPNNKRPASSPSPAAGAAAVVLCLLMVVLFGRVGATLLMSTALYLFPRRWPATTRKESTAAVDPLDGWSATPEKRKVVMERCDAVPGLEWNRNK
uniref:Uncharacterized protein n=1 Tax=Zea mays TaxID=4577 RepID=B6UBQ5_MAIZE|nr:hypothetical protein [Zea mays]|eukprot:NP_001145323.1 uncharacterized protein LOC100278645 [Zea mays]